MSETERIDTLKALQKRIREATGPDRDLDLDLMRAFYPDCEWTIGPTHRTVSQRLSEAFAFTTYPDGLGACVALMLELLPGAMWEKRGREFLVFPVVRPSLTWPKGHRGETRSNDCLTFLDAIGMTETVKPAEDPNHPGNTAEYHTGKPCIVKGCKEPAGTWWGPSWCQKHNAERLERIGSNLDDMIRRNELRAAVEKETADLRKMLYDAYGEIRALVVAAGGKITVMPEHYTTKIIGESVHTPKGKNGPKTYNYMFERRSDSQSSAALDENGAR